MKRSLAIAAAVTATLVGAPGAAASGGIEDAKRCADAAYLGWNPQQMPSTVAYVQAMQGCSDHLTEMASPSHIDAFAGCVRDILRSPAQSFEQPLADGEQCVESFLGLEVGIDPTPATRRASVRRRVSGAAGKRRARGARARSHARRGR